MTIIKTIITFCIWILIQIGDGVLFLPLFLWKKKTHFFHPLRRTLKVLKKSLLFPFLLLLRFFHWLFKARKKQKKTKPVNNRPFSFWAKLKYFLIGSIFSTLFIFLPFLTYFYIHNLPSLATLSLTALPQTTKIFDRHHTLLYQLYATQNRTIVPLATIPSMLQKATIAIEDKNFYTNPGFDLAAIVRAAVSDIGGKSFQGGSTITQQLIKSTLLTSEISYTRKIKEITLAFWAEKKYSKQQILEMYLNQVPYGGTAWGVEAASEIYFNKRVTELDLAECAFLAGMPRAPSIYSPYGNTPTLWKKRQKAVLASMYEQHFITKAQQETALTEELVFQTRQTPIFAPHFVMYIKDLLIKKYGLPLVEKGGLSITTSLDLSLQNQAQQIVHDEVEKNANLNLSNGAAVITNPQNGDILAMVGSKNYNDPNGGTVNIATSLRQPGSSIKLVTYTAALSHGFTAATILDDSPVTYSFPDGPSYSPVNYDGKFHGKVPLRIALANSFNIPAVKLLNQLGLPLFLDTAKTMGIQSFTTPERYGLSITLGGAEATMLDMATAYGTIAHQGARVDINPILQVTNNEGQVLEKKQNIIKKQVIAPEVAFILSDILADSQARALEFGLNTPLTIPNHIVSVKTGTSDDKRDNWTIGFTKNNLVTVWVGNNDNSPMSPTLASGITGAAPIWHALMGLLLQGTTDIKQRVPENIIAKPCFGKIEYFIKGTESSVNCAYLPSPSASPQLRP